jgi:hypothetical protein
MRPALALLAVVAPACAHDVISTRLLWTQEISRIIYKHCAACHREGGAAPMPLATYEQARPLERVASGQPKTRTAPEMDHGSEASPAHRAAFVSRLDEESVENIARPDCWSCPAQ